MTIKVFINLPVEDLERSKAFFNKMDFKFDPKFSDENAACLIVSDDIYVMLLVKKFFKRFTPKEITDSGKSTEAIIALAVDSREKVDELYDKAMRAGAKRSSEQQDQGGMYGSGFEDLDGHLWEVFHMDGSAQEQA